MYIVIKYDVNSYSFIKLVCVKQKNVNISSVCRSAYCILYYLIHILHSTAET